MTKIKRISIGFLSLVLAFSMMIPTNAADIPGIIEENTDIQPYASVRTHYKSTPYAGRASQYTYKLSSSGATLSKQYAIASYSTAALARILMPFCPLASKAADAASFVLLGISHTCKKLYIVRTYYARKGTTAADRNENQKLVVKVYQNTRSGKLLSAQTIYIQNMYF